MGHRFVITDRHGLNRTIDARQDESDETKWHLAEPAALEPHDIAVLFVEGHIVATFRHEPGQQPFDTVFHMPR